MFSATYSRSLTIGDLFALWVIFYSSFRGGICLVPMKGMILPRSLPTFRCLLSSVGIPYRISIRCRVLISPPDQNIYSEDISNKLYRIGSLDLIMFNQVSSIIGWLV